MRLMNEDTPLIVNGILTSALEFSERICASMTHNRVQLTGITSSEPVIRKQMMPTIMTRFIQMEDETFLERANAIQAKIVADGYTDDNDYVPANSEVASYPLDDVIPRGEFIPIANNSYTYDADSDAVYTKEDAAKLVASNQFLMVIHEDVDFFVGMKHKDFYDFNHYHVEYAKKAPIVPSERYYQKVWRSPSSKSSL